MTPAERLEQEKQKITEEVGYYIPPYRAASMMKAAHRIMELLSTWDVCVTYTECRAVLKMVERSIDLLTEKEKPDL